MGYTQGTRRPQPSSSQDTTGRPRSTTSHSCPSEPAGPDGGPGVPMWRAAAVHTAQPEEPAAPGASEPGPPVGAGTPATFRPEPAAGAQLTLPFGSDLRPVPLQSNAGWTRCRWRVPEPGQQDITPAKRQGEETDSFLPTHPCATLLQSQSQNLGEQEKQAGTQQNGQETAEPVAGGGGGTAAQKPSAKLSRTCE